MYVAEVFHTLDYGIRYSFLLIQLTKQQVDCFWKGPRIPNCQLSIKWINEKNPPVSMMYRLKLVGAKEPFNFIYLEMPVHRRGMLEKKKGCLVRGFNYMSV